MSRGSVASSCGRTLVTADMAPVHLSIGGRVLEHERMVRHVLAIYQATRAGRRAVREASAIAAEHGAQLTVARVTGTCGGRGCCAIGPGRWERILREEALADLEDGRSAAGGEPVHLAVIEGAGAPAIASAAERIQCDLVVVPVVRVAPRGGLAGALRRRTAIRVIGVRGR
jgi:nucleotide-binding universal stress UspA family protein